MFCESMYLSFCLEGAQRMRVQFWVEMFILVELMLTLDVLIFQGRGWGVHYENLKESNFFSLE